jgi:hypothetical protein
MEFLSPEGQMAAQKLRHAEFVLNSSKKIVEIKLKATPETKQYCEEIKNEIRQKLVKFYEKNFPGLDYSEYIDNFSRVFDEHHSQPLYSYFGSNVSSAYCASIWHLLSTEELTTEIKGIFLQPLTQYFNDITLHLKQYIPGRLHCVDFFFKT